MRLQFEKLQFSVCYKRRRRSNNGVEEHCDHDGVEAPNIRYFRPWVSVRDWRF